LERWLSSQAAWRSRNHALYTTGLAAREAIKRARALAGAAGTPPPPTARRHADGLRRHRGAARTQPAGLRGATPYPWVPSLHYLQVFGIGTVSGCARAAARLADSASGPTGDLDSSSGELPSCTSWSRLRDSFLSKPASLPAGRRRARQAAPPAARQAAPPRAARLPRVGAGSPGAGDCPPRAL